MHVCPPPSTAHPASGALQSLRSIGHKQSNGIRQTDGAGTAYSTGLEHTAQAPLSSLRRTLMEAACIQLCDPLQMLVLHVREFFPVLEPVQIALCHEAASILVLPSFIGLSSSFRSVARHCQSAARMLLEHLFLFHAMLPASCWCRPKKEGSIHEHGLDIRFCLQDDDAEDALSPHPACELRIRNKLSRRRAHISHGRGI